MIRFARCLWCRTGVWLDHEDKNECVERRDLVEVAPVQIFAVEKVREVLKQADDDAAKHCAADAVEPAEDRGWEHLDAVSRKAGRHAVDHGDNDARHRGDGGGNRPRHREHAFHRDAERLRNLLVERCRAHRKAVFRDFEEPRHASHHRQRNREAEDVDGLHLQPEDIHEFGLEDLRERLQVGAEDPFHQRREHCGQRDRHHDDGDDRFADHRAQDHKLDRDAEQEHEDQCDRHADPERHLILGEQEPADPSTDQQQFSLREIDHLRGLVDKHERHRDHAVERADNKAVNEKLDEELGVHEASRDADLDIVAGAASFPLSLWEKVASRSEAG